MPVCDVYGELTLVAAALAFTTHIDTINTWRQSHDALSINTNRSYTHYTQKCQESCHTSPSEKRRPTCVLLSHTRTTQSIMTHSVQRRGAGRWGCLASHADALSRARGGCGGAGRVVWGGRSGVDHTRGISTSNVPSEGSHHSPKNVGSSPSPSRRRSLREMIVPAPCRSAYSEPKLRAEVSVFE